MVAAGPAAPRAHLWRQAQSRSERRDRFLTLRQDPDPGARLTVDHGAMGGELGKRRTAQKNGLRIRLDDRSIDGLGWARTAHTEREREIFLQIARAWLEAAERAVKKDCQSVSATKMSLDPPRAKAPQ